MTLKEAIFSTYIYYSRSALNDQVLAVYLEDLADLDPKECIEAYQRWRRNPANKHFPLPAQIRELVNPEQFVSVEARAREVAARITGAVSKYGWNNGTAARVFIGPEGWEVVQRQGGWNYLCENLGTKMNPTSFQAQVRDQLDGVFRHGLTALEKSIGAIESRSGGLATIGEIIRAQLPDKPNDEGPGAA